MPLTVLVPSAGEAARLTFDGTQRIVIGRGASSDVRLPDPSVSLRHASLKAQGADFVIVDEGSTNGTVIGGVQVAPHTSRLVRSGDRVRLGRIWLELRIEKRPVTRDPGLATRDLALSLVSRALAEKGEDTTAKVRVVEGPDQGATLALAEGGSYVIGRSAEAALPLADTDVSREHVRVTRREGSAFVRDFGAKNGTLVGDLRVPEDRDVAWRPAQMMRIGRSVLSLEEPVVERLAEIESAVDEAVNAAQVPPSGGVADAGSVLLHGDLSASPAESASPMALEPMSQATRRRKGRWSAADVAVMLAATVVLILSLVGLVWLLRT